MLQISSNRLTTPLIYYSKAEPASDLLMQQLECLPKTPERQTRTIFYDLLSTNSKDTLNFHG